MSEQSVQVVASLTSDEVSVFVVAEPSSPERPANGGLRILSYPTDDEALAEAKILADRMRVKHRLYGTGFNGGKIVARVRNLAAKKRTLDVTRVLLDELDGRMLTGCDLNVTSSDMEHLAQSSPHVRAAIGHSVDASRATGVGVVAAFIACTEHIEKPVQSVLVHGIGAVGRVVGDSLSARGYRVLTVDRDPGRTLEGCEKAPEQWWSTKVDAVVMCSASGLITTELANSIQAHLFVSGANAPFRNEEAQERLQQRGCVVLPDALANAGAVIVDSIEHYTPQLWQNSSANAIYEFVSQVIQQRCAEYLELAPESSIDDRLDRMMDSTRPPIAYEFSGGVEK